MVLLLFLASSGAIRALEVEEGRKEGHITVIARLSGIYGNVNLPLPSGLRPRAQVGLLPYIPTTVL